MKSLYKYISYINKGYNETIIDCHAHMFGASRSINYPYECPVNGYIAMVDNPIRYPERSLFGEFKTYIDMGEVTHNKPLLCVGKDVDETQRIYNEFQDKICGFGEIKCYKRCSFDGQVIERYDTSILHSVLNKGLPVFIHWDLDGKYDDELYNIIKSNPDTKFVLCHCGFGEMCNHDDAFKKMIDFQYKLPNLWLSISWTVLDYFVNDDGYIKYDKLSAIPDPDRVIAGTDINPQLDPHGKIFKHQYDKFIKLAPKFNVVQALNNLFP